MRKLPRKHHESGEGGLSVDEQTRLPKELVLSAAEQLGTRAAVLLERHTARRRPSLLEPIIPLRRDLCYHFIGPFRRAKRDRKGGALN